MSRHSKARSDARGAAKAAGGAHLTRQARMGTLTRLFRHLQHHGFQVAGVDSIKERHIAHYIQARLAAGKDVRTLQNDASHIRGAMRAVGRAQAADSPTISNKALGIAGSSRAGTKVAASDEQYQDALALASGLDEGLVMVLRLERALGLRAAEAIRCGPSLATWERQLLVGHRISVVFGTKGGRRRESTPADRLQALDAVRAARSLADSQGGRLIDKRNLRVAMTWYRNTMSRKITPVAGFAGHALRYAYAADRVSAYGQSGLSSGEALAHTSVDLGHGDGRGRYVAQVYTRSSEGGEPRAVPSQAG